jgi:hypothetical protein
VFEVTAEDISQLNDVDLRELVARLCEAELVSKGLSPSAVTWGGSHTAKDGGLDVRVTLHPGTVIGGFIPRPSTGFQVKKPDMPPGEILAEMKPGGRLRPAIQELANLGGAYVIVSSTGSTTDSALAKRNAALRLPLAGAANADCLHTEFFDRQRLATWARQFAGITVWVRERLGRSTTGWRPFGDWCGNREPEDATYLLDDKLRLNMGKRRDAPQQTITEAIDEFRDELASEHGVVRLVGLAGVGKTRFVQALFDERVGARPLPKALAVYANLNDNPDPQPMGLAADLIAQGRRAVLVVDNCPPDLHSRLVQLCTRSASKLSLLTVEYDVRDDHPEQTRVVSLETASNQLIEQLVRRRFKHISQVDARSIANASGGNARIAIAIAETVTMTETVAGLSSAELFDRLLLQRGGSNEQLVRTAQACSLVYSYQGEAITGQEAELPRLAAIAGLPVDDVYRRLGELQRRELVQQRGEWRAVLPHAFANRLAVRALQETRYDLIKEQLLDTGNARLMRSFSRRLAYLHDHEEAVDIVDAWLAPGGLLGDVLSYEDVSREMFTNVASVSIEAALKALERGERGSETTTANVWARHRGTLRSIAFDPSLFQRCCRLLAFAATRSSEPHQVRNASDAFISLFPMTLSGTHATLAQRLEVLGPLLKSKDEREKKLALAALDKALQTSCFNPIFRFEFGARPRDYGYTASTTGEVRSWFQGVLSFIERTAFSDNSLKAQLGTVVAQAFHNLWTEGCVHDDLDRLSRRFAAEGFWREGWAAVVDLQGSLGEASPPHEAEKLLRLETALRARGLVDQVQALGFGMPDDELSRERRSWGRTFHAEAARTYVGAEFLGKAIASDEPAFDHVLPDLAVSGYSIRSSARQFGRGLAQGTQPVNVIWDRLLNAFLRSPRDSRNTMVLQGVLSQISTSDSALTQKLLDQVLKHRTLRRHIAAFQSAVDIDTQGLDRLRRALARDFAPVETFRDLYRDGQAFLMPWDRFSELVSLIAERKTGFSVALNMLVERVDLERLKGGPPPSPNGQAVGRHLLSNVSFNDDDRGFEPQLGTLVRWCLAEAGQSSVAAFIATRLRDAVASGAFVALKYQDLLEALLEVQPIPVLQALFVGGVRGRRAGAATFATRSSSNASSLDVVPVETLLAWCRSDPARYVDAARVTSLVKDGPQDGILLWSDHAEALLRNAPEPGTVVRAMMARRASISRVGSVATLLESYARLLDNGGWTPPAALRDFVAQQRENLLRTAARERASETARDRKKDERFE